ncbi:MAG: AMP-binding protein [Gammaproteobacteria bacterium]|nr:AMP-binding protein [Gammaproteobacteria bacterium]
MGQPEHLHPAAVAARDPQRPALTLGDTTWTYAELEAAANGFAHGLRAAGLMPGDGIAVLLGNRLEVFVAYWAAMRSGLYYTPISTHLHSGEIAWILQSARPKLLLTSPNFLERLEPIADSLPAIRLLADAASPTALWQTLEDFTAGQPDTFPEDASEGAALLFSSGTTGRPKGVINARPGAAPGTIGELARRRMALHEIDERVTYLSTAPLYHSAPLRYTEMVLRSGGRCVIMEKFDATRALELIERHRVTHSQWVPTMFVRLLRLPEDARQRHDLSSHRYAVHAAAPCPPEVKRAMLDWWGPILHEYYSATEANGQTVIGPEEWLAHPGSVGRPLLGEVRIRDAEGRDLPAGETGLVYLGGGARFEYLDDPEKTAAAHAPDGLSTLGDIGHLDADGYLYLTDRRDFTIISGGVNIYPREVEDILLAHPRVADAAVFGLPDDEFGERVHAVVEPVAEAADDPGLAAELSAFCRQHLAHLKCPRDFEFRSHLPRLPTGKLAKGSLRLEVMAALGEAESQAGGTLPLTSLQ